MRTLAVLLLVGLLAPLARAEEVTRGDLARAFLDFERALYIHPPAAEAVADLNRRFDRATLKFFRGDAAVVHRDLLELAAELRGVKPLNLLVRIEPPVPVAGAEPAPVVRIATPGKEALPPKLTARLQGPKGVVATAIVPKNGRWELPPLPVGVYEVEVGPDVKHLHNFTRFSVVPRSLDRAREELLAQIEKLPRTNPELLQAVVSLRERVRLLKDHPSPSRSAELLLEPVEHLESVTRELEELSSTGRDPYRGRGHLWRAIDVDGAIVPFRLSGFVELPPGAEEKIPLVIALHGAGGDENLFFEGYGAGLLSRLADRHCFLAVAPHTVPFSTRPEVFDALVETLARDFPIDPDRVLVLGHSMGAMAAAIVARARRDCVAAVCLIAGRPIGGLKGLPSTLYIAGGLDPLMPGAPAAREEDEIRTYPDHGHTLVVAEALPRAIEWLLAHSRTTTSEEE
jgi:predicted esterase